MQYEKDFLRQLHSELLKARMLEQKMVEIYAQGIVPGHIHSGMGQEASYVGVLATRKAGDYFKLGHRPLGIFHILGEPLDAFFGELLAKTTGNAGGRGGANHLGRFEDGVVGFSGTLGADAGVSVGAALTIAAEKRDNVSYFFYGDGTASRGPVHEAMCLASAWKLPVLFVCDDNQFAISTPRQFSSAIENPGAGRAAGYGMPSVVVDGTDILAVYEAASEMTKYVREGRGPAVVECKDYRWKGHFEGDQCPYRDAAVTQKYMDEKDSLKLFETKLIADGVLTEAEIAEQTEAFEREMNAAVEDAVAAPEMKPEEIFDNLYV